MKDGGNESSSKGFTKCLLSYLISRPGKPYFHAKIVREAFLWYVSRHHGPSKPDPEDALTFFRDRNGRADVKAVLVQWAMRDPEAAAKAVHEGAKSVRMEQEVLEALARQDPAAAVRFALASPDRRWLEQWAAGSELSALEHIARHDFGSALSLLSLLPADGARRATHAMAEIALPDAHERDGSRHSWQNSWQQE